MSHTCSIQRFLNQKEGVTMSRLLSDGKITRIESKNLKKCFALNG